MLRQTVVTWNIRLALMALMLTELSLADAVKTQPTDIEAQAVEIVVTVKGLENIGGQLLVALEKSAKAFDDGPIHQADYQGQVVKVRDHIVELRFSAPPGAYAIKTFHDENGNYQLDSNLFGVPKEKVGFSNDASATFGPASFKDARFEVGQQRTSLQINLR